MQRENARFENNLRHSAGDLYYSPQSGFLWSQLSRSDLELSPETLGNWITKQAVMRGIVVVDSTFVQEAFTQRLIYKIAGAGDSTTDLEGLINVME